MGRSLGLNITAWIAFSMSACATAAAPDLATKLDAPQGKDFDAKLLWYSKHCYDWARQHEADGDALRARGDAPGALAAYLAAVSEAGVMVLGDFWELGKVPAGFQVTSVAPDRAAARAGVKAGDVVTHIDGRALAALGEWKLRYLVAMLDTVPLRPMRVGVTRGGQTLELHVERQPGYKWCVGVEDARYLDGLESKVLAFMVETGQRQPVNDNMRWAAGVAARALRDAKSDEDRKYAREDLRATSLALIGWGDAYFNCGVLLDAAGDAVGAERCYRQFVLVSPGDPQASTVAARFASLGPLVKLEADRKAFEGWWAAFRDGQRQSTGSMFKREGALLSVTNLAGQRWLRGTIVDEFHAEVVQTLTAGSAGGRLGGLITKCFGGTLEGAGTMTLSPDKQRMTMSVKNDIDVDANTCAIVRQNPTVTTYVR